MHVSNAVDVLKYFEQIDFATADNMHQTKSLHVFSLQEAKNDLVSSCVLVLLIFKLTDSL